MSRQDKSVGSNTAHASAGSISFQDRQRRNMRSAMEEGAASAVSRCPLHTSILKCLSNTLRLPTANPVIAVILHVRADLIITLCELQISMLYLPKAPPQESASAVEAVTKERTAYVRVGTPQYLMTPSYYVCECRVLMSTYMHMHMIWISSMCVCVRERDTHTQREREREREKSCCAFCDV